MNFGKIIPAALAVTVFVFAIDYVFYGMLMNNYFTPPSDYLETPRFLYLAIATFILGFLMTHYYILSHGAGTKVSEGFKHGALIGLLVFGVMNFIMYGITDTAPLSEYLVDTLFRVVQLGIAGIIIAYITGLPDDRHGVKPKPGEDATPPPPPPGGN